MKIEIIEPKQAQEKIDWSKIQLLYRDYKDGTREYVISTGKHSDIEFTGKVLNRLDFGSSFQFFKSVYRPAPKGTVIKITQE